MSIKQFIKPNIRELTAYDPDTINCRIKLDANESPYGFPIPQEILNINTSRYPDPKINKLREFIAKDLDVREQTILFGNGSDELIYFLITAIGGPVLIPTPTFSMYSIISHTLNEQIFTVPLDNNFDLNIDLILKTCKKQRIRLIFLSSPNNPTGNCFDREKILTLIKTIDGLVIVDEAYQQFSERESFIPLLKKHENLVIFRTLSKIGLAALRIGFMIGTEELIEEINKVRLPFNINSLSQAAALSILSDRKIDLFIDEIIEGRAYLYTELLKIKGIKPYPSEANFILFYVELLGDPHNNAEMVYNKLIEMGILVRNLNSQIKGCLRVTVGTRHENETFLNALKLILTRKD